MLLTPRYEAPPLITIDGPLDDQLAPLIRQRHRLASMLRELDDEQWAAPSRCDGWSVQDVVAHLIGTNHFWAASIAAGRAGSPTQVLAAFDPVVTPAAMVDAVRALEPKVIFDQLVESHAGMESAFEGLDADGWRTLAESPPGHVDLRVLAHHALWDCWIHERDIALPLGIAATEEPDEVVSCLRYVSALAPAFAVQHGSPRRGAIVVHAEEPAARIVVEVGDAVHVHDGDAPPDAVTVRGRAVDLVDMLSIRLPFTCEIEPAQRWLFAGLAEVFDTDLQSA